MSDIDRQLGAFLRSLDQSQFLRFCAMIQVRPPNPDSGLDLTWQQWRDNRTTGILAAKRNNPPYYESVILHAFPASLDGQELLRHVLSINDNELCDLYRQILDKSGLTLHTTQRPQFTLEIIDCEQLDPARWARALRLSGVKQLQPEQADSQPDPPTETSITTGPDFATPSSQPVGESQRWSRQDKLGAIGILVTILLAILGWFVFT